MRMMAAMVVIWAATTLAMGDAAQQAKKDFEQLFGEQVQTARKTPATDDNLACAQRILEAARESTLSPELMTLLCDAAADLAGDAPGGQKLAAEALALLTKAVPGKADYAQRKSLDVAMKQYAAAAGQAKAKAGQDCIDKLLALADKESQSGDAAGAMADLKSAERIAAQTGADLLASSIRTRIKSAECKAAAQKKAASLEAQLKAAPNDAPARESLVKLYLLDLDRPAEAARFLTPDSDVAMRANIPLAAGAVGDVAAGPSLELAQWYEGLSGKASDEGAGNALRRARAYAQHFLDVHPDKDAKRLVAVNLLGKIEAALEKYEPKADWVNVLKGVELNRHVRLGTWAWSGSALGIVKARDRSRVLIPSIPDGDYELMATFSRAQGPGSTRFYLPVGGSSCTLVLGEDDDQACGLDALDDNDATINPTRTPAPSLAGAGKHTVRAMIVHREQKVHVTVILDGKALLAWSGTAGQLSLPDGWGLSDAAALGLGAGDARVTYDSVQVRMLSGRLKDSSADESAARKAEENQNKTSKARAVRVKRVKIRLR